MESEERCSTASTVSGIYRNILQSPAPICMFYFSHPFGIASPPNYVDNSKIINQKQMNGQMNYVHCKSKTKHINNKKKLLTSKKSSYIPWPTDTWRRDYILPPLVQMMAKQMGHHKVPDLESIIRSIRQAWNTPNSLSAHNCTDLNAFTSHQNNMKMFDPVTTNNSGLLRRRYSVPEIIMRKHCLARQESTSESSVATSVPTPIASPMYRVLDNCSSSTGSESNIISCPNEKSLRNQLLRRIWNKGYLEIDHRSNSWSFPIRRIQRNPFNIETPPERNDCIQLEQTVKSPKHMKLLATREQNKITPKPETHSVASSVESSDCPSTSGNYSSHSVPEQKDNVMESDQNSNVDTTTGKDCVKIESVAQLNITELNSDINLSAETEQSHDFANNNKNDEESIKRPLKDENRNNLSTSDTLSSKSTVEQSLNDSTEETGHQLTGTKLFKNFSDEKFISSLVINQLNKSLLNIVETKDKDTNESSISSKSSKKNSSTSSTSLSMPMTGDTDIQQPSILSAMNNVTNEKPLSNERKIYFPNYSIDFKDDQSTCCTPQSSKIVKKSCEIVPVYTGSCYLNQECAQPILVSRSIYRTESTEAQPSTASTRNELTVEEDSDESLVDSLDDVDSPTHTSTNMDKEVTPIKHSESFFVPITENSLADDELNVKISMPDKLRKKLVKRHKILDNKKNQDNAKKQTKLEKIINRSRSIDEQSTVKEKISKNNNSLLTANAGKTVLSSIKSSGNKFFRSEIGLLETYTIDAKGNIQFQQPQKLGPPSAKRKDLIKSMPTKKQTKNIVKMKRIKTKKSVLNKDSGYSAQSQQQPKHPQQRCREVIKDVKQVTLYQAADIITPDNDCGPKRMYQKTEISDGEKRIEILEIVECIDSSSCSEGISSNSHHNDTSSPTYVQHSQFRKSKIPIPIPSSSNAQKSAKTIYKVNSSSSSSSGGGRSSNNENGSGKKVFIRNTKQMRSNLKVDEMIADLLIDALNNPEELTIDYIKSPKQLSGSKSFKRGSMSSRRMTIQDLSKHSANNSTTKYHQVFEVIPEEKSGLSVDSSTDDVSQTRQNLTDIPEKNERLNKYNKPMISQNMELTLAGKEYRANGKAALQDELTEPKAWMGFFKQHDESSVDSGNEDGPIRSNEDEITSPQKSLTNIQKQNKTFNINKSNKNKQHIYTTTTVSTASTNSSTILTPISSTDLFLSNPSTGSNVCLTLPNISNYNDSIITSSISSTNNSIAQYTSVNCNSQLQTTTNCIQCWHIENTLFNDLSPSTIGSSTIILNDLTKQHNNDHFNTKNVSAISEIQSISTTLTTKQNNDQTTQQTTSTAIENVWQVDDEQIKIPPKIHYNSNSDEKSIKTEIDSTSFIVLRDGDMNQSEPSIFINDQLDNGDIKSSNSLIKSSDNTITLNNIQNNNTTGLSSSHSKCDDCCYCNPDLHKNNEFLTNETICNFCKLKKSNSPPLLSSTSNNGIINNDIKTKTTSTNTHYSIPEPEQQRQPSENGIYEESVTKKDHTHIRTKSKDSDTVSLKCTKINSKIRRIIPEDSVDINHFPASKNSNNKKNGTHHSMKQKPQNHNMSNLLKNQSKTSDIHSPKIRPDRNKLEEKYYQNLNQEPNHKPTTCVRLPSPFAVISSHGYDSSHSSNCSTSSSSSSTNDKQRNRISSPGRWQTNSTFRSHNNHNGNHNQQQLQHQARGQQQGRSRSSRYEDFYGNGDNEHKIVNSNEILTKVNDRLNNSAKSAMPDKKQKWSLTLAGTYRDDMAPDVEMKLCFPKKSPKSIENITKYTHQNQYTNNNLEYEMEYDVGDPIDIANEAYHHQQMKQQQQQGYPVNLRAFDNDSYSYHQPALPPPPNLNPKRTLSKATPDRLSTLGKRECNLPEVTTRTVARQTAQKTFKRSEYSTLAVASATARTVSNFANGKRAMSFQALNASTIQLNSHRQPRRRDHSIDLGNITSSRNRSIDSPVLSEVMALSVLGNAIAPEQKPRVPTMSERDVTRRQTNNFTRNRIFFS